MIVFDAYAVLADQRGVAQPAYSTDLLHLSAAGYEVLNNELARILATLDRSAE